MTDDQVRRLNAELGLPPASAERWLHDLRADERREHARRVLVARERWPYAKPDWWDYCACHGDPRGAF